MEKQVYSTSDDLEIVGLIKSICSSTNPLQNSPVVFSHIQTLQNHFLSLLNSVKLNINSINPAKKKKE
jgi:hypothetical protein